MKRGVGWPIGISLTLAALVAAYVRLAVIAADPSALVVEPNYYQKAVHWDDQMQQEAGNLRLGWTLAPMVGPVTPGAGAELRVTLRDSAGAPLSGATVAVVAVHNAIAHTPLSGTLSDRGDGSYAARLPFTRAGQWQLRFEVRRGGERFTADLRVDAALAART
jgi:nitrogen fixation protein FixH